MLPHTSWLVLKGIRPKRKSRQQTEAKNENNAVATPGVDFDRQGDDHDVAKEKESYK
jgi:hypothetical protein